MLVDRLKRDSGAAIPTQEDVADAGASLREKVIAASAVSARSENEFQKYRHQLVESGVDARTEQIFRSLAQTLPGWTLPEVAGEQSGGRELSSSRALDAMRRIITSRNSKTPLLGTPSSINASVSSAIWHRRTKQL